MKVWGIADLHLSFGVKNKEMDVFGPTWTKHYKKIEENWRKTVKDDDLVLIAGDISWGLSIENVLPDLLWIDQLPGIKVMIKGNHDLWWKSHSKVLKILPPSIHLIHNDAFTHNGVTIAGTRLWENQEINYNQYIEFRDTTGINVHQKDYSQKELEHDRKIYKKELDRLCWSIDAMDKTASTRIVMVHYPPIGPTHEETAVTRLLDNEGIDFCLYGHLHNLKKGAPVDYQLNSTKYICTACDWLNFTPYELVVNFL